MPFSNRAMVAARVVLSASALVILTAAPELLGGAPTAKRAVLSIGVVVFGVAWLAFWWFGIDSANPAVKAGLIALLVATLAVLTYLVPPGRDGLVLAALAAGAAFGTRRSVVAIAFIALLAGAVQLFHGGGALTAAGAAVNDVVVGAVAIGGRLLYTTSRSLTQARDEIARLAVSEERLRMSRDLHDWLGQNLTLAVLKSELVARDMPPDAPESVRKMQIEVADTVRQSLDDVRTAVAGYRRTDLRTELEGARAATSIAGIELSVQDELGVLPSVQDGVLAWALREGITNVIRHSRATRCVVQLRRQLTGAILVIEDDGPGVGPAGDGHGLAGIAERAAAIGGSAEAFRPRGGGFKMTVSLPLRQA